jgi:hypothetical protein
MMLEAMSVNGAVSLGLIDLIDTDFRELDEANLIRRYWGTGAQMCTLTEAGRLALSSGSEKP